MSPRSTAAAIKLRWHEVPVPGQLLLMAPMTRGWQAEVGDGHLSVFAGREPDGFHLSISHRKNRDNSPGRYPFWDEVADARYRFAPAEVTMAMLLPPTEEYVNVHATTFHLWEIQR